jgi:UDP-N-acetylmuramate--alanine ligase
MHTRLHFVGIGGIGMSGIAQVFFNQGYLVTGSDVAESESVRKLRELGIPVAIGHAASNVEGAKVVVISSAIRAENPEVIEAKRRRIPVIPRAEMLGELMRGKTSIAVAGTHGKTTTTSLLASIFTAAGLDPTIVIGGKVDALGGNAKLGKGHYVVAEADESDGSFLHLPATHAIVTNVDNDHLDHFGSMEAVDAAFVDFVGKLPFYGVAAVCAEDAGVRRCLDRFTKPFVTYGFGAECDYVAKGLEFSGSGSTFEASERVDGSPRSLGRVTLQIPGKHNVLNALAAVSIARRSGIAFSAIQSGLENFKGVGRRFETKWKNPASTQMIVDDYGHHPTEIAATLSAARGSWKGRIICVFQPHRYTRTALCKEGFATAFAQADVVLVTDIYAAGEDALPGISGEGLVKAIDAKRAEGQIVRFVGSLESAGDTVRSLMKDGDLVLCMGAGSITRLPDMIVQRLKDSVPNVEVVS